MGSSTLHERVLIASCAAGGAQSSTFFCGATQRTAALPAGGCGAAALLVGPDAPLVLQPWPWRSSFSAHTYDFFKPHGHPLYPVVDGPATLLWFTKAADAAAAQLHTQLQQQGELPASQQQQEQQQPAGLLDCYDYFLSHSPYNKIVRKVFGRLVLQDALRCAVTT